MSYRKSKNSVGRKAHENSGLYCGQVREVNPNGQAQSIWIALIDATSFDAVFDYSKDYLDKHRGDDDIKSMEFRITNPYGHEVAIMTPPGQDWVFKKDEFAEHDLVDNVENLIEYAKEIQDNQRYLSLYATFTFVNTIGIFGLIAMKAFGG